MTVTIDAVWLRIRLREGSTFRTKQGTEFTYRVRPDNCLQCNTTSELLYRHDFEKAIPTLPVHYVNHLPAATNGASYVWAILHDKRVRMGDW